MFRKSFLRLMRRFRWEDTEAVAAALWDVRGKIWELQVCLECEEVYRLGLRNCPSCTSAHAEPLTRRYPSISGGPCRVLQFPTGPKVA